MQKLDILLTLLLLLATGWIWGQKNDPKVEAVEKHYQYLESDFKENRANIQKEAELYRQFIQQERAEHQKFLEQTITYGGYFFLIIGVVIGFLGFKTYGGIQAYFNKMKELMEEKIYSQEQKISELNQKLVGHEDNLVMAKNRYEEYIGFYKNSNPKDGRFLFVGESEKITSYRSKELINFEKIYGESKEDFSPEQIKEKGIYDLVRYDVVVYLADINEGLDSNLESIIDKLLTLPIQIPLVVFTNGQQIKGTTNTKLINYVLYNIASNSTTLIDNTAMSYRVSKLTKSA